MRILAIAIVLSLAGCNGSGSSPYYCYGNNPIVSNLTLTPSSAIHGEGGGSINGNVTLHYKTGDDAKIILFEYRIENASGMNTAYGDFRETLKKSGDFEFPIPISTTTAGIYTVRVRAVDECLEESKWVDAPFQVIVLAAMAGKSGYATVASNDELFFIGGVDEGQLSKALLQYDPATQQTELKAPMPEARELAAAATHSGKVYVFGGLAYGFAQDSTFVYDPASDAWTAVAPMSAPMAGAVATTIGARIYVESASSLSRYDPELDIWEDMQ